MKAIILSFEPKTKKTRSERPLFDLGQVFAKRLRGEARARAKDLIARNNKRLRCLYALC